MELAPGRARLARAAAPLAGLIVLAAALAAIDTLPVGVFIDDAMYVILAKALATGQGYHWLNLPGAPAATHFPPAYPLFLAAIWRVFPTFPANVLAFKAANAVLLAIVASGMVVFARRRFGLSAFAAVVLSVASCAAIPVLVLSALVLSEPLFLALLIPLLLFAEQVVDGERRTRDLVLLGLLAGIATLVRTHGIALTGALAVALVLRAPPNARMSGDRFGALRLRVIHGLVVVVCAALVMLPWQLWVRANHGLVPDAMRGMYESYASWLAGGIKHDGVGILARTSVRTSTEIAGMFATLATPFAFSWARFITIVTVAVLLIAGLKKSWHVAPVTALFFVAYVTIVVLWPFGPSRFIWGIWPLVILICALGAVEAKSWAPRMQLASTARMLLLACTLFVSVGYVRYNVRGYRGKWWSSLSRTQAQIIRPVVLWARSRTRPDEVIGSTVEPAVYLYSGRLAVPVTAFNVRDYFRSPSVAEAETALRQIIAGYHVDAIAIGAGDTLRAAVRAMASRDELVVRDTFVNGVVFAPAASSRVSSQPPAHQ